MRILVVEDEQSLASLIWGRLSGAGFEFDHAASLQAAKSAIEQRRYSLALLDRRLPDGDGMSLIPLVRKSDPGIRILMLTALDSVSDRIDGLDAGADDYLIKPFDIDELLARIRANLRRTGVGGSGEPPITVGSLRFDLSMKEASVSGRPMILHRRELALLESLARRVGRVAPREIMLEEVYGRDEIEPQSNALDALVSRLRKHLTEAGAGVAIHPVRGVGYMLAKMT